MSTSDHIRTMGSAVTIITGAVAFIFFFEKLNERVGRLEEQVHMLTQASLPSTTAREVGAPSPQLVSNPAAPACADLAKKIADEISKGYQLSAERIQKTMADMGCARAP